MVRIGITSGLRGYFAVLYDNDGPIQSGIGSYKTPEGARSEAMNWAMSEWGENWIYHVDDDIKGVNREESKHPTKQRERLPRIIGR